MDELGGVSPTIFGNTHIFIYKFTHKNQQIHVGKYTVRPMDP